MPSTAATDETIAALTAHVAALSARCDAVLGENAQLRAQVAWFQRQLFGRKSERRIVQPDAAQGTLGEAFDAVPDAPVPGRKTRIAGHERSATPRRADVCYVAWNLRRNRRVLSRVRRERFPELLRQHRETRRL
ncbi:hypothetical protein [Burkholderia ubonensis]|uniref:IS66 family transposase n=1 Tax=Burkholderia ubonensis TaxID=101571 RepID=UPI000A88D6A5|nr:hypothetical protein [Burkholderia ubonensis]